MTFQDYLLKNQEAIDEKRNSLSRVTTDMLPPQLEDYVEELVRVAIFFGEHRTWADSFLDDVEFENLPSEGTALEREIEVKHLCVEQRGFGT